MENLDGTRYLSVRHWIEANPLSRTATYAAIRENRLPHVRVGRKILIPEDALDRLVVGGVGTVQGR